MSELPKGWEVTSFRELFGHLQYGLTAKADSTRAGVRFLRITDLQNGAVDWQTVPGLVSEAKIARYRLSDGDFVFARSGSIEKAARIRHPPAAVFASYLIRGEPVSPLVSDWLDCFIRSDNYLLQIKERAAGIGMSNVNATKLSSISLPLAPLPEQRRIVTKIDSLSAKSKRSRDHLDHIPRLVEKYKQAILAAAFRGELTREWRTSRLDGDEQITAREHVQAERDAMRIKAGLRAKGRNRSIPAKVLDLPALPSQWDWLTFDDCAWDLTVGHVGPMKDRYINDGIPFLRSLNVRANCVDLHKVVYIDEQFHRELEKSKLVPGDLIVVRTGEPGVAAVVPAELKVANILILTSGCYRVALQIKFSFSLSKLIF